MTTALFVADQFSDATRSAREKHPGGAELTDQAALEACPWPVERMRFDEFDPSQAQRADVIVVGNSQRARPEALAAIARTRRHVLFEHDVRICVWNGNFPSAGDPVHRVAQRCWCPHPRLSPLYRSARGVIFLTERQRAVYEQNPFFACARHGVLGCSLFSRAFFDRAEAFAACPKRLTHGTAVVYSVNAIKGYAQSLAWARAMDGPIREIRQASPDEVLDVFAKSAQFVYLPIGLEPAGRLPVEARLFGCDVFVNAHVGVSGERWWIDGDRERALDWLGSGPRRFWQLVEDFLSRDPTTIEPHLGARLDPVVDRLLRASRAASFLTRRLPVLSPSVRRRTDDVSFCARW